MNATTTPYAAAWRAYYAAGWPGVLPLPPRAKKMPPTGYTGDDGAFADASTMQSWADNGRNGNIALRLPNHVVGIDVDAYKEAGAESWATLLEHLGDLPPTWRSSARTDGRSGIYLFRVPPGVRFPGVPAPCIEIVQFHHRYAIVWPSINPKTDTEYRWLHTSGEVLDDGTVPVLGQLPELPDAWLDTLRSDTPDPDWLLALKGKTPPAPARNGTVILPSAPRFDGYTRPVGEILDTARRGMVKGSRHDTALAAVMALVRFRELGTPCAADALDQLRGEFVAAISDRSQPHEAEKEWNDMVAGAAEKIAVTPSSARPWEPERTRHARVNGTGDDVDEVDEDQAVTLPRTCLLPSEFWESRPWIGHVRTAARARMVAPDALLGAVLARAASLIDYRIVLPAVVARPGSLNLFVGLAGSSGDGKGSVVDGGEALIPHTGPRWLTMGVGSGEGMVKAFFRKENVDDGSKHGRPEWVQAYDAALIRIDEGGLIGQLGQRSGQTTFERLRELWSGEKVGSPAADADRGFQLPAHAYRCALVAGFQPELAAAILDDTIGGTAQRFVWLAVNDPEPAEVDALPEWPGPLEWRPPTPDLEGPTIDVAGMRRHAFGVAPEVAREIRTDRRNRLIGDGKVDDSHRNLSRLKVAAVLAALDERLHVTPDDWRLAGTIIATSAAVRDWMRTRIVDEARRVERSATVKYARRQAEAARASTAATVETNGDIVRVAEAVRRCVDKAGPEGARRADLSRHVGRNRHLLTAAIAHAEAVGWITEEEGRWKVGQ